MSTRSGRNRPSAVELSPPRTRKGISPPRSPARTRKSTPPPSPSRKSPSRKSPSRKSTSKFPARKSPSRTTKDVTESAQKSPQKRVPIKTDDKDTSRTRRSEYSIKDLSVELALANKMNGVNPGVSSKDISNLRNRKPTEEVAPRRSSRLREFTENIQDVKRSMSKSVSKSDSMSIDKYSDEDISDVDEREKSKSVTRKLATPIRDISDLDTLDDKWEFGGRIGTAFLLVLIPAILFPLLIASSHSYSIEAMYDLNNYKGTSKWFGTNALIFVTAQYVIQAVFAVLPILGKTFHQMEGTKYKYCFNGFASCVFTITFVFVLEVYGIINMNVLLEDYVRLAVVSYLYSFFLAILLYPKARRSDGYKLNPYGITGYMLYDFCIGREIHPHFKKLDIKIWTSRICNINAVILAILVFRNSIVVTLPIDGVEKISLENFKQILNKVQLQPTILMFSIMQIIYILNSIVREYKMTTTFYWQSEGMGYMQLVSSAFYPFYFTTISKFVYDTGLKLSTNTLIIACIIYLLGFFLMTISNHIKYEFRTNPLRPRLRNVQVMPTFHGKKLLISGPWGYLRHPNYAGDILMHISFALPGILSSNFVAALPAFFTILVLLHRAWRDHARCRRRYGAAWQRYSIKVPSVIIPKVL